jgi:hypothetical protein
MLLAAVQTRPAHGYAMAKALRARSSATFDLPEGTLYPALHRLERAGLLLSRWSEVSGRWRRVTSSQRKVNAPSPSGKASGTSSLALSMKERGVDTSAPEIDPREHLTQFLTKSGPRTLGPNGTLESLTWLEDTTDSVKRGGRCLAARLAAPNALDNRAGWGRYHCSRVPALRDEPAVLEVLVTAWRVLSPSPTIVEHQNTVPAGRCRGNRFIKATTLRRRCRASTNVSGTPFASDVSGCGISFWRRLKGRRGGAISYPKSRYSFPTATLPVRSCPYTPRFETSGRKAVDPIHADC